MRAVRNQYDRRSRFKAVERCPRGTMDEVSSLVRLTCRYFGRPPHRLFRLVLNP